jgi:hypothetical protein
MSWRAAYEDVGVRGDGLAVGGDDPHVGRRRPERVEVRVQRHGLDSPPLPLPESETLPS